MRPPTAAIPPMPPAAERVPECTRDLRVGDRVVIRFPGGRGHWEAAVAYSDPERWAVAYTGDPARAGRAAARGELATGHLPNAKPARLFVGQVAHPPVPPPPNASADWLWLDHRDIVKDDE